MMAKNRAQTASIIRVSHLSTYSRAPRVIIRLNVNALMTNFNPWLYLSILKPLSKFSLQVSCQES